MSNETKCSSCKGSGRYVGLFTDESCDACGGSGLSGADGETLVPGQLSKLGQQELARRRAELDAKFAMQVDRQILTYDGEAADAGKFTKKLIALMKLKMRRNSQRIEEAIVSPQDLSGAKVEYPLDTLMNRVDREIQHIKEHADTDTIRIEAGPRNEIRFSYTMQFE